MGDSSTVAPAEWRRVILLALCLIFPLYLATASWGSLQSVDPRSTALAGWQVAKTGGLAFDSTWVPESLAWPAEGADGRTYSNRFPGVIALAAAGYCAAELIGVLPDNPTKLAIDLPMWPATLMAVLAAVLAAVLTWRLFRETRVSPRFALASAGLVALGSPLWSLSADALWTHGPTHALLAGSLLSQAHRRVVLGAVLAGVSILVRPHLAVSVLVMAVLQDSWRGRLIFGLAGAVGVAGVAGYSLLVFGQPLPTAGYDVARVGEHMAMRTPGTFVANIWDWLFDPRRGVVVMVPVVLIAIPHLRQAWSRAPHWVRVGAIAGAGYGLVQLSIMRASGGSWFFGHRTTIEALVLASPLLALSISEFTTRMRSFGRVALLVTVGFSLVAHTYGAIVDIPEGAKRALADEQEEMRRTYSMEQAAR